MNVYCMYICVHVFVYICVCIYIYLYAHIYMYVCMNGCMYVCMHVCMHVYMHACMHKKKTVTGYYDRKIFGPSLPIFLVERNVFLSSMEKFL
jgi:hypothetical protein